MNNISKIIDKLPPESSETIHDIVRLGLHYSEMNPLLLSATTKLLGNKNISNKKLEIYLGGKNNTIETLFPNPVFVGAGWDKNATCIKALLKLGAGSVEIGSVPFFQQEGNDKPRAFGLPNGVVINRYGFNTIGAKKIKHNLENYPKEIHEKVGISLGLNKEIHHNHSAYYYALVAGSLINLASYFVINVSSPNTPGLRDLQKTEYLEEILEAVQEKMITNEGIKPLFLKVSPDVSEKQLYEIIRSAIDGKCTGIIATNTTVNSEIKQKYGLRWGNQEGGLSGNDSTFRNMSTEIVNFIYENSKDYLQIIGVGGVNSTYSALEKLSAGADAIQVITGIREKGLSIFNNINRGLLDIMDLNNIKSISDIKSIKLKDINTEYVI